MHILIIPSERYMPKENPIQGIFQHHQALVLKTAGCKIGIIAPPELVSRSVLFSRGFFKWPDAACNEDIPVLKHYLWYMAARIPGFGMWLYFNSWERLFKRYLAMYGPPDVIHAHNARFAGVFAARIKRRRHIPYVLTEHSSTYARDPLTKFEAVMIKEAFKFADKRLVVSPNLGSLLEKVLGKDMVCPWECLPNVLGPVFEKNACLKDEGRRERTVFCFLNIGSLIKLKGQEELLRAFADRFRGLDDVQLRIGGAGHLENELKCMADKLEIGKQVKFLGMLTREEALAEMRDCDVYVHSSHYETFGVVIIEALSCGKPVVATACGGPESILNEANGILVSPHNIQALGEAMVSVKDRMADYDPVRIREDCIARFGSRTIVNKLTAIYSVVKGQGKK